MPRAVRIARQVTPESAFRSAGIKWLKLRFGKYLWHYRTVGGVGVRGGVPDDLFCIRGIFVAVEWKQPNYRPSSRVTQQDAEIEAVVRAGGRAAKVWTWEQLEALVEGIQPVQMAIGRGLLNG